VKIRLAKEKGTPKVFLEAVCIEGDFQKKYDSTYTGKKIGFDIPPKLLQDLLEKKTECEITEVSLRVEDKRYVYAACLKE
jgi:hypothetical protein